MQTVINGILFTLDPTGHWRKGAETHGIDDFTLFNRITQACGLLPQFMFGGKDTIAANMEENYKFGIGWQGPDQARIDNEVFYYPGDPPQYPYLKAVLLEGDQEIVYIYPYAQVCVVVDGQLIKRQRMD